MSGFTKGPWWAHSSLTGFWQVSTYRDDEDPATSPNIGSRFGASIAMSLGDHTEKRTSGSQEANAHLIAAAPELYEAGLRLTEEAKAGNGVSADALNQMLSALAKARGETEPA